MIEFPRAARPPGLVKKPRTRRIIAVGGGKGGIGKTLVSVSFGIALAQRGHRVVLVDVDLGGANLHTCLGLGQPARTLSDFVGKRAMKLEDLLIPSGIPNLSLISGAQDVLDAANPKHLQKVKLLRHLQLIDADYVVLDLGAGTSFNVLDFFLIADHGVVVLLPEPTSIENAYRFVKAAFFRRMQNLEERHGTSELVSASLSKKEGAARTPPELLAAVRGRDPALADRMEHELRSFRARLVVNQARSVADHQVGPAVAAAWKKFFGLEMDYLGAIGQDDEAWRAVRRRRPLLVEQPGCTASAGLLRAAENLLALDGRR